jgi:hypothetical protein
LKKPITHTKKRVGRVTQSEFKLQYHKKKKTKPKQQQQKNHEIVKEILKN